MAEPTSARRRSVAVAIPAVTFLAASVLTGCQTPGRQMRACVDPNQQVIDQRQCDTPGGIGRYYYYRGGSYLPGQTAGGGTFTRGGSKGASASQVGRGGFGGKSTSGG